MTAFSGNTLSPAVTEGLLALHRYRLLSVAQVATASGLKPSYLRDILRVLERKRYLGSIGNVGLRGGSKAPKLYFLNRSGYDLLRDGCGLEESHLGEFVKPHSGPKWTPIMAHRMATIDLLLAVETGLRDRPNYELITTFHEYRRVKRGTTAQPETSDYVAAPEAAGNRIVPDAGFVLENCQTGKRGLFFIETDRGTMRLTRGAEGSYSVAGKFALYERYLRGLRFADTYGPYGVFSFFTVLFATTTQGRLENARLASADLDHNLHPYFRLATLEIGTHSFFDPIWLSRDVRDKRHGTLIKIN